MTSIVGIGVDGSPASIDALAWALALAQARTWEGEVVTAWPGAGAVFVHEVPGHCSAPRERVASARTSS